jgi:23S rRNA pseudouridine2605 synthase
MDLVADACPERLFPVGRLDRNTTGLLLLTNDGALAEKLMHPSKKIKKIYEVGLDKPLTKAHLNEIREGLILEDGVATVDEIEVISPDKKTVGVEIHIGRNRIVRRIFEHLGYEVTKLDRVMFGPLTKKNIQRGSWRFLDEREIILLKHLM